MKLLVKAILLTSIIAITTQDITGRKGCDCTICKGVDNKLNPTVGKKLYDKNEGKSSCNICEKRKEMLRLEREKQRQLQKCPFEVLGSPALKGRSSQEIFDEFRELIVPSQNGFFDMMRGIVRTMHFSSEAELQWAKEKEAKELAKKREEELKKLKESKLKKEEIVNLQNPVNPKVTVVLKQTPCGQIIAPSEQAESLKVPLIKRLPKEINEDIIGFPEEEFSRLQSPDFAGENPEEVNYMNLNLKDNLLHSDLFDQLDGFNMRMTPPQETVGTTEPEEDIFKFTEENNFIEGSTDSPFVKYISNDEMKAQWKSSRNSIDDIDMDFNLLPTSNGKELPPINN